MHIVYVLQSVKDPARHYVGHTKDMAARLAIHNRGEVFHTAKWHPWRLVVAIQFTDEPRAIAFEKYLKSGSGRAFAKRHF